MKKASALRVLPILTGLGFIAFGLSILWDGLFDQGSLSYPFGKHRWIAIAVGVAALIFGVLAMRLSPSQLFRLSLMDLTVLLETDSRRGRKPPNKKLDWRKRFTGENPSDAESGRDTPTI